MRSAEQPAEQAQEAPGRDLPPVKVNPGAKAAEGVQ